MPATHWFRLNEQDFEIEEGSPTWERLTAEGYVPVDGPEAGLSDTPAKPATKAELVAAAVEVGVEGAAGMTKAELVTAIEEAEAGLSDTPPA